MSGVKIAILFRYACFFLLDSFMQPYLYKCRTVDTDALPDLVNFLNQLFCDIKGDADPEILVVVRSVGSGSYLAAYAFGVVQQKTLVPVASVTGLAATADPVAALKNLE